MTHCKYCHQELNRLLYEAANWDAGIYTVETPPSKCPVNGFHVFRSGLPENKQKVIILAERVRFAHD